MTLRPYQRQAIDATYRYWKTEGGSPLINLATGAGKSMVLATLIQELLQSYPDMRVLVLVHVQELVQQNFDALIRLWPGAPAGINSAGLRRRDTRHPILFASIQSVHRHAARLGRRDLVLIDECHLLPHAETGTYHNLLKTMRETTSPDLRLFGCTATPYRLDSGRLDRGDGRLFDRICYSYNIGQGVRDGFLSPLVSKATATTYDVTGVQKRGGEFVPGALADAVDKDSITKAAVAEMVAAGATRRSWLVFATSVAHAEHIAEEVASYGVPASVVSAKTPARERAATLEAFKTGRLRCLVNMGVLTTGFDAPATDLVALMRPTLSPGLLVQMIGRAVRKAPGKKDALILDFARNIETHGPVDEIEGVNKRPGPPGAAPVKVCETCLTYNPISARTCVACGMEFFVTPAPEKIQGQAATLPILALASPLDWKPVEYTGYDRHTKMGSPIPTLCVIYHCGRKTYKEFLCFEHPLGSFPQRKAAQWWTDMGGRSPVPTTVLAALSRDWELRPVDAIRTAKDGDYDRVLSRRSPPQDIAACG